MRIRNSSMWLAGVLTLAVLASVPAFAEGTAEGTVISNTATVSWTDGNGNARSQLSNTVQTTVTQIASVIITPDTLSAAGLPGDTIAFAHTVENNGNGDDTIQLSVTTVPGWTVALYRDNNGNGTYEPGTDTVVADTGVLAAEATFPLLVVVTVPSAAADGASASFTVTGTSAFDPAVSDTATDTVNVEAPNLTIIKSVDKATAAPGEVLTYTVVVANAGARDAGSVVVTDPVPGFTTFVSGSITLDAVAKTDGADLDEADHNVSNAGAVTVNLGVLAPGATRTVTFQVTVN